MPLCRYAGTGCTLLVRAAALTRRPHAGSRLSQGERESEGAPTGGIGRTGR
jgi:hypothetical protein